MRNFYRSHLAPAAVVAAADTFFPPIGLTQVATAARARTFSGPLGTLKLSVRSEGGHYTWVEANTDQMGESRLDRNVKRFFVTLHQAEDDGHMLAAAY
ncbi:MAG: hypothetical protein NVS4B3_26710 [Gemmatimonadaceae bacterium]